MLESLAANLLNRVLGAYVENFDPNQLNVGIWSGDVTLKNLKLKKDCLDALDLPIDVNFGILGSLILNVPWSSLKNKPVKITIEECYLLCEPKNLNNFDSVEQLKRDLALKLKKLAEWEIRSENRSNLSNSDDDKKNNSFMQSLLTKIVDNLQVTIKKIHIRYEDQKSILSKNSCSIGITLSELSAVSADENWNPSFIAITQKITNKLLTLNSLCFYWNTNCPSINHANTEELLNSFRSSIATDDESIDRYQYILKPVSGTGRLCLNKAGTSEDQPHIELRMFYDQFGIELDDTEYEDFLYTISNLNLFKKAQNFIHLRPKYSVKENSKGWFKYVGDCVLQEIKEKNEMWTWPKIQKRCNERRQYIDLWVKKLKLPNIEEPLPLLQDDKLLDELQSNLDFEDIILFRTLAKKRYLQLKLENQDNIEQKKEEQPEKKNSSWLGSWWGGKDDQSEEDLTLTEEQKKELYEAIEFSESEPISETIQIPKDRAKLKITSFLKKGSFSIKRKTDENYLGEMIFENCDVQFLQRPDSYLASYEFNKFRVEDGSPDSLYKHIINVKDFDSLENSDDTSVDISQPLFKATYESNPLDASANSKIDLKLRGMTIFYHVNFIASVMKFFSPPKQHLETVGAIINAAEATVEGWTTQSRMGIEAVLEEHKTKNINCDLQAPLIIIPMDPYDMNAPCAIVDAGHIKISSDPVSKEKIQLIKDMTTEEYDKLDSKELDRLMYDRYLFYSQDTQILVGPDLKNTLSSLNDVNNEISFNILEKMQIALTVDSCIMPKAYNLSKYKAYGRLPKLSILLNDYQYKIIMQLLQNVMPSNVAIDAQVKLSAPKQSVDAAARKEQLQLAETLMQLDSMTEAQIAQPTFDLHLDVNTFELTFFKCIEKLTMKSEKLVTFLAGTFSFNWIKQIKGFDTILSVHSLDIFDFIQKSDIEELNYIVSSGSSSKEQTDLFSMKYKRRQRIIKHNDTLISVFDQDIKTNMEQLKLVLTPRTILTLLNYSITTFTDPTATELPADALRHNKEGAEDAPQKLSWEIAMAGITLIFNDDSVRLATLVLSAGEYSLYMLPEKMKTSLKLGGLELTNDLDDVNNIGFKTQQIITMNGEDLVEFSYESFDAADNNTNFDSILKLYSGSLNVNFIEGSINRLANYFYRFQLLKNAFTNARQSAYNQTPSIDTVNKMKLDVVIRGPFINFSEPSVLYDNSYDNVEFYSGDFFIKNVFLQSEVGLPINQIELGMRDGKIKSVHSTTSGESQLLDVIENFGITFNIDHSTEEDVSLPDYKIDGTFNSLKSSLTEIQIKNFHKISETLSRGFTIEHLDNVELDEEMLYVNTFNRKDTQSQSSPELSEEPVSANNNELVTKCGVKVDFVFNAPEVALTLYNNTASSTEISKCGLTRVKLEDSGCSFVLNHDGTVTGKSHISAFTVEDIRDIKDNKHIELIPKIAEKNYQFSANFSKDIVNDVKVNTVSLSIDSPRVILAMDYLYALKQFYDETFGALLSSSTPQDIEEDKVDEPTTTKSQYAKIQEQSQSQYIFNIVNAAIIVLADPSDINSEAVVFNVGQILMSNQNITSFMFNNVGIFLTKMGSIESNRVRIIDDYSASVVIDRRDSTEEKIMTTVQASVEPLIMRISLRDIRLAMLIFNKALSLINQGKQEEQPVEEEPAKPGAFSKEFEKQLSRYIPELAENQSSTPTTSSSIVPVEPIESILKYEKLTVDFGGLRLILIGDIHEMPILDINVTTFEMAAKDWSSNINLFASFEMYINVFNYSRSSWEPLLETTPLSFQLSNGVQQEAKTMFNIISNKISEVTISARTIAMLSTIPSSLSGEITLQPRGAEKPYTLVNDTGLDLEVWISSKNHSERPSLTLLPAGSSLPWEFEDWRSVRERLDVDNNRNILGFRVAGAKYKTSMKVDATNEGEFMHTLNPPIDNVHNRIVCQLELRPDFVKVLTFRSTLEIENNTDCDVEFLLQSDAFQSQKIMSLKPSESKSIPIEQAYTSKLWIRPADTKYDWPLAPVEWKSLLSKPSSVCCGNVGENNSKFYFEVTGKYDKKEPLAKIYPHMKIILSSPIVLENLLPCDIGFSLFNKREERRAYKVLQKNQKFAVHDVSLDNFLLLSIQPLIDDASVSKPIIVHTPNESSLREENHLRLKLDGKQKLRLSVHYQYQDGERAKVIKLCSPYIIFNETGRDIYIEGDRNNISSSLTYYEGDSQFTTPKMFSFDGSDQDNRAVIRFKGTDWSEQLTFDAVGQSFDTFLSLPNKELECNLGVTILEGKGKHILSKMVKITPRYIIHNDMDFSFEIAEPYSGDIIKVEPASSLPLYRMKSVIEKQLQFRLLGERTEWSAPIFINDVGLTFLKVTTEDGNHKLLKVNIVLENATLFIRVRDGEDTWPYSIRNFSDQEFIFYQRDPRITDDLAESNELEDIPKNDFKPILYRVPPRSVMAYAWDFPAARQKKLVIRARERTREVQLAELGTLKPMRLPGNNPRDPPYLVDLNVVADGPVQALVISKYNAKLSLYKLKKESTNSSTSINTTTENFEANTEESSTIRRLVVKFEGVGASFINANLQELFYVNIRGIELRFNESDLYKTFSWKVKWLQIDNQMFNTDQPNIIYPTVVPNTESEIENHPILSGSVSRVKDDTQGVAYYKHLTVLLQELSIKLDENFLYAVLDFVKLPGASWNTELKKEDFPEHVTLPEAGDVKFSDDIYFENFHIQPTMLHVSFQKSDNFGDSEEDEKRIAANNQNNLLYLANMLTTTIGNVNDAPIKLNSLYIGNVRTPALSLLTSIRTHYGQQFFFQLHKILGSADFLGNPVGLFNTISSGFMDMFYEPYRGYMMNDRPQEIGLHLAKGGLSFAKKTVFGFSDSMSKLTGSMAKGLAYTQDSEFQRYRKIQKRMAMNNGNVLANSAQSFATTLASGFAGLALDPINGAQKEGAAGFAKGVGKGIIGLPAKTAIGFLDLASNLSQGVKTSTNAMDMPVAKRFRLTRYIGHDRLIKPYSEKEAQGQSWLKEANGGIYINDKYLVHVVLPGNELVVIVSMEHIIEVKLATEEIMWSTPYSDIQGIVLEKGGIYIKMKSQSEYFIPIADSSERKVVYKQIAIAVTEFNKYCEATL